MQPDTVATIMEKIRQLYAICMMKNLLSFKFQKMGQILCVKKVTFRKSDHI